ncbi:MAG: aldehyde dehydrogenase [Phycisphaerales bacterium]|nr:aldehyde dehydrogenase [Phycisphaerales bacterium]
MTSVSRTLRTRQLQRARWARSFGKAVRNATDEFVELVGEEIGKPRYETVATEILPLVASCKWHARHAPGILKPRRIGGTPWWLFGQRHELHHAPLGRVAVIATWNYPVQLLGIQIVQALVAGNDVVVKPSEHAGRTQQRLLELAREAGLPEEALDWTEATREAGAALLAEHDFDHVVFTGSTRIGRRIAEGCATNLTASTLELSGHDSAFVLKDGDARLAARSIWAAVCNNAGQTCMAPRRALVHRDVYREFCDALVPLAAGAQPRRLVLDGEAEHIHDLILQATELGGRTATGVLEPNEGASIRPTAVLDCPDNAKLTKGDYFGPAIAVIPFDDLDEAIAIHRAGGQHLATSVYTGSPGHVDAVLDQLDSSTVTINDTLVPTGHPGAAIAGHGLSGWGASRGRRGLEAMTRPMHVTRTPRRLRLPVEPPSDRALAGLERMIGIPRTRDNASQNRKDTSQTESGSAT